MRPYRLVVDAPGLDDPSGLGKRDEDVLLEAFVAQPPVEALDEGILHRLAGRDLVPFIAAELGRYADPLSDCRRNYVRDEALEVQFTELLGRLRFDDEVLEWVRDALHASYAGECRDHDEAIKRLEAEGKRIKVRIHAMFVEKLDELVDTAFLERTSNLRSRRAEECLERYGLGGR